MWKNRKETVEELFCGALQRVCAFLLAANLMGCTAMQLEHSTVAHANTFSDIMYKVALDNVAMFKANEGAVPSQIVITQGTISIIDSAAPSFSYAWPFISRTAGISASRTWDESWSVVPVTESTALGTLRDIYKKCARGELEECKTWPDFSSVVPGNALLFGNYGTQFVSVKPGEFQQFGDFVMRVMKAAEPAPNKQSFTFPGAIAPPRSGR
jgi:hypothetical protein